MKKMFDYSVDDKWLNQLQANHLQRNSVSIIVNIDSFKTDL